MAIAYSDHTDSQAWAPGTSISCSAGMNVSAGDLVVILVMYLDSSTITVTDDSVPANTGTQVMPEYGNHDDYRWSQIFYSVVTTSHADAVWTANFGTSQTGRTVITAMHATKAAGETWFLDGGNKGVRAWGTTLATGSFSTNYNDGITFAITHNPGDVSSPVTYNIANSAASVVTSPHATQLCAYLQHGKVTDHVDYELSSANYIAAQFYSFGVTAPTGRTTFNTDCCDLGTANGMGFGMKRYR
jgi:hypothetical protein